jgi:hypothetical protein
MTPARLWAATVCVAAAGAWLPPAGVVTASLFGDCGDPLHWRVPMEESADGGGGGQDRLAAVVVRSWNASGQGWDAVALDAPLGRVSDARGKQGERGGGGGGGGVVVVRRTTAMLRGSYAHRRRAAGKLRAVPPGLRGRLCAATSCRGEVTRRHTVLRGGCAPHHYWPAGATSTPCCMR